MSRPIHHKPRRPARLFLREWMEYRGLTGEALAERMDTSKSVVSKLINGRQRYNQEWLEAIAHALDCEVIELFRPPTSHEINDVLNGMSDDVRRTALNLLKDMAKWETNNSSSSH